jgi:hypothetical protein
MAQAKTRASAKRSRGSQKSQARSRGSSSKPRTSSKSGNSASRQRSKSSTNSTARVDSARRTVEHAAKDAGQAVGRAASKAKVPLVAGGAALAGAAGGLALGVHQAHRRRGMMAVPRRPQLKVNSRDLAKAAKEVGTFGAQMGHLASELQRTREVANGGRQHRSPVEVVLEGLTARRSAA